MVLELASERKFTLTGEQITEFGSGVVLVFARHKPFCDVILDEHVNGIKAGKGSSGLGAFGGGLGLFVQLPQQFTAVEHRRGVFVAVFISEDRQYCRREGVLDGHC